MCINGLLNNNSYMLLKFTANRLETWLDYFYIQVL